MVDIILDLKARNLAEFQELIANAPAELEYIIKNILVQEGVMIASEAKDNAPVKTRELRDSIHSAPTVSGATVTSGLHYAKYQEYGTKYMAPKNFMKNALESAKPRIRQRVEQAIYDYFMRSVK